MRPAGGIDDYLASPVGRYVSGRCFVHFFHDPGLCGLILWGEPDGDDARAMGRAIDVELPRHSGEHASIVDARRLGGVDPTAFDALVGYFVERSAIVGTNVTRHALVRPAGVAGAVVAGFWSVAPSLHPERTRVFTEIGPALRWLERPAALADTLDALHAAASDTPRPIQALRDLLDARSGRVTLGEAARTQRVSPRTLQARLRETGTTFRAEVNAARVRAAKARLAGSDEKLAVIALEVGCSSPQHFSALFRKTTGESPSAWRVRARRAVTPRTGRP